MTAAAVLSGFFNQQVRHAGDQGGGVAVPTFSGTDAVDAFIKLCVDWQAKGLESEPTSGISGMDADR